MSPSNAVFALTLPAHPSLRTRVFDAQLREVSLADVNGGRITLPLGLYSVRVDGPTGFEEQIVRLDQDVDLSSFAPKRFSAAPIASSQLSHEYYAGPSQHFSLNYTRKLVSPSATAELFIFVRAIDRSFAQRAAGSLGFALFRSNGMVETSFRDEDTARDAGDGWLAFSAAIEPGFYRLRGGGDHLREFGVHAFPGWQTQIFLLVADGPPILEAARVFIAPKGVGFSQDDAATELVDDAIVMLADPSATPSEQLLRDVLDAKFDNPVLGLIGAHLLLRAGRRGATLPDQRRFIPELVIDRLQQMLGPCSDVKALRVATFDLSSEMEPTFAFNEPPMLLAGVRAVLDAAAARPTLVADSPLMDDVSERLFADSIWTTWDALLPAPIEGAGWQAYDERAIERPNWRFIRMDETEIDSIPSRPSFSPPPRTDWLPAAVLAAVAQELTRSRRSASRASSDPLGSRTQGVSIAELARQLEVTPQGIARAVRELNAMSSDQFMTLLGDGASSAAPDLAGGISKFIVPGE